MRSIYRNVQQRDLNKTIMPKNNHDSNNRKVRFVVRRFSYHEPPQYDSPLDPKSLYYTVEDLSHIKKESQATVEMMCHGSSIQEDRGLCSRGLECRTIIGSRKQLTNQTRSLHTVIEEQEQQRKRGVSNPERIAAMYKEICNGCQAEARSIGIQDSIVAKRVYIQDGGLMDSQLHQSSSTKLEQRALLCRREHHPIHFHCTLAIQVCCHGTPANA